MQQLCPQAAAPPTLASFAAPRKHLRAQLPKACPDKKRRRTASSLQVQHVISALY